MTIVIETSELRGEVEEAARHLEGATAAEIVSWTERYTGGKFVVTSSFSDAVLVDVVHRVVPDAHIVFIDTGFHFPETLAYVERVAERYSLNLEVLRSGLPADVSPCGSADCCQRRKVDPLQRALTDQVAWVSGIRRSETPERADSPVVDFDEKYSVVKVNPIVAWSDDEVMDYIAERELPIHPLTHQGYLSIGCAPVTVPTLDPDDPRSGRWAGTSKTECGLHL